MPTITIEVTEDVARNFAELVRRCVEVNREGDGANSHGELTVPALLEMLAEDAALVVRRPGS